MADQYNQGKTSGSMSQERDVVGDGFSRVSGQNISTSTPRGVAEQAKDVSSDLLGAVDDQRGKAADQIETVAGQLRDHAEQVPGGDRTTELAQKAAGKMESAAGYVRDADINDLSGDLERLVRQHPTGALVTAVAIGFLAGRAMRG